MRELAQSGTAIIPAAWLTDVSVPKLTYSTLDPSVSGETLSVGDSWAKCGVASPYGALAVGTARYTVPATNVAYVSPTGSDGAAGTIGAPCATVNHARTLITGGGTVVMRAGTYHESFTTTAGDAAFTVINYPGEAAWFDGSVVTTGWSAGSGVWTHTGIPTTFSRTNGVGGWMSTANLVGDPAGGLSDQVFLDGTSQVQIADAGTPAAGQFSVDYGAGTITIGSDPTGKEVRVSDLRYLCQASSVVSWKGVGVRRYSPDNTSSVGAAFYYGGSSAGSVFENVEVSRSAMAAFNLNKHSMSIRNCTIKDNFFTGIGGTQCDGITVDSCLVQNNNVGQFKAAPATAGIKITSCVGPSITRNNVADNNGANGIWTDSSCVQVAMVSNRVTGNHRVGMQYEESDGGLISSVQYRSVVAGNLVDGAVFGMQALAAGTVDIFNNTIRNCSTQYLNIQQDRDHNTSNFYLPQTECPWDTVNITVANNVFGPQPPTGITARVRISDSFSHRTATAMNAQFRANQFLDPSGSLVQWGNTTTWTSYSSLSTLQAAEPAQTSGNVQGAMADASALAMPANVAAALGVPIGTKKIGSYLS